MGAHPNSKFVIRFSNKKKNTNQQIYLRVSVKEKKQTLSLGFLPAQFGDPLYYLPGTPLTLVGHRGSCPFDQIFYRHVSGGCFRPRFGVVVPVMTHT